MLELVLLVDHLDAAPPLRRARGDRAQLDEHGAHASAQGEFERVRLLVALEQGVHGGHRVGARGDEIEDGQPPVGLIEGSIERAPVGEQPPVQQVGPPLRLGLRKRVHDLVCTEGAVPHARLGDVAVEMVLDGVAPKLGANQHGRHLVGELRAALRARREAAVHVQAHRVAIISGVQLMPLVGCHGRRGDEVPRLDLAVEEGAQLRVEAQPELAA